MKAHASAIQLSEMSERRQRRLLTERRRPHIVDRPEPRSQHGKDLFLNERLDIAEDLLGRLQPIIRRRRRRYASVAASSFRETSTGRASERSGTDDLRQESGEVRHLGIYAAPTSRSMEGTGTRASSVRQHCEGIGAGKSRIEQIRVRV